MGIINPRILPKTFTGQGHQVTVNDDRTIQVKPGDWLSKYTMAIWGDCTKQHLNAFLVKREGFWGHIDNPNQIKAGDTLYVDAVLPGERLPPPAPRPFPWRPPTKLPRTFSGHGYQVTVDADRTIKVRPGDWLSKYAMAIWGYWSEEQAKGFRLQQGTSTIPITNPNLIKAGDTLYVSAQLPGEPALMWRADGRIASPRL
ncbi:MAG TPA: hypothetical protein VJ890_15225 [Vineibacter sp.]|nr:hypothetical protein [Vineibacter sp.]